MGPTTPIIVIFTRMEDWKIFSKAREYPFSEKDILSSAYLAIEDTELFNLPYDTWQDKPTSAKNWIKFKIFFNKESAKIKHHTTGSVGLNDEAANTTLQLTE